LRTLHPAFLGGFVWAIAAGAWSKMIGGCHGNERVGQNIPGR
jgi:hypothetical protein